MGTQIVLLYLNNLGIWLGKRFERTGSMDDLKRAVKVTDMALNSTPQGHPDRASLLNSLGIRLARRFERTGSMGDLNRAIDVAALAVNFTPQDHPSRLGFSNNPGGCGSVCDSSGPARWKISNVPSKLRE